MQKIAAFLIALAISCAVICDGNLLRGNGELSDAFQSNQKFVGILYETWFNHVIRDNGNPPMYPQSVPQPAFRFWAEPALGFYKSDDRHVINVHADQMADAHIDFIIVDYSNNNINDESLHRPLFVLLDEYVKRLHQGRATPKITFLIPSDEHQINELYNQVYKRYPAEIFFKHQGKPLLMPMNHCSFAVCSHFTSKPTWGLQEANDMRWSFMDLYPQAPRGSGNEQMSVSAAQQVDWMSNLSSARGRNWSPTTRNNNGGKAVNFKSQFVRAMETPSVRFVLIKAWNEWASQNLDEKFTDEFNEEFSNDIEPMKGGHGDFYLQLMKKYAYAFKNGINFDCKSYLTKYQDLKNVFGSDCRRAREHFLLEGIAEGRDGSRNAAIVEQEQTPATNNGFNCANYLNRYQDVRNHVRGDCRKALEHWNLHGIKEGRIGN